jgi:hypothetical protein
MLLKPFNAIKINSYTILALFLLFIEAKQIGKAEWTGDFWEHSAVVNELSRHLLHPDNPIIGGKIPHAFVSPYSLIVAFCAKLTHLSSIEILGWFAFFNLVIFVFVFYLFCKHLFKENHNLVASVGLILILFFWGKGPAQWSGFYHMYVLNYVLPYPSTFAMALIFLILVMISKNHQSEKSYLRTFLIVLLTATVFITHPTTGVFLSLAIIALNLSFLKHTFWDFIIQTMVILLPAIALCLFWPYFYFTDLLLGHNSDFNNTSIGLYYNITRIYWPILFVLPIVIVVRKNRQLAVFFLTVIILSLVVFAAGYMFKVYGIGRIVSSLMMFSQVLIAFLLVYLLKNSKVLGKVYLTIVALAFAYTLFLNSGSLQKSFKISGKGHTGYYTKYSFLCNQVNPDDIILADHSTSWYIPSFSGKVIASKHPLYWVDDIDTRRTDVAQFFKKNTSDTVRCEIIKKYHPDYLLLNKYEVQLDSLTLNWLQKIGTKVYDADNLELFKLKQPRTKDSFKN